MTSLVYYFDICRNLDQEGGCLMGQWHDSSSYVPTYSSRSPCPSLLFVFTPFFWLLLPLSGPVSTAKKIETVSNEPFPLHSLAGPKHNQIKLLSQVLNSLFSGFCHTASLYRHLQKRLWHSSHPTSSPAPITLCMLQAWWRFGMANLLCAKMSVTELKLEQG